MKKVLIISYHFPPDRAIGGRRPFTFARHLPAKEWDVTVLTVTENAVENYDSTEYLSLLPQCRIIRVKPRAGLRDVLVWFKRLFTRHTDDAPDMLSPGNSSPGTRANFIRRLVGELKRFVVSLALIPDWRNGWILPADKSAKTLLEQESFDVILSTGPPNSGHVAGFLLRRRFSRLCWIADFQDPWTGGKDKPKEISTAISRWIETRLMRAVCRHTDALLVVTKASGELMASLNRSDISSKTHLIPCGFDDQLLKKAALGSVRACRNGVLHMTHLGLLYHNRSPEYFFRALSEFVSENSLGPADIRVRLIGPHTSFKGKSVEQMRRECSLEQIVSLEAPVSHEEALRIMVNADVLLLFAQGQHVHIPGKVYEYLFAKKPLLALCEQNSETGQLLDRLSSGVLADPYDTADIKRAIRDLYYAYRDDSLVRFTPTVDLSEFLPDAQADVLSTIMKSILSGRD